MPPIPRRSLQYERIISFSCKNFKKLLYETDIPESVTRTSDSPAKNKLCFEISFVISW